MEEWV